MYQILRLIIMVVTIVFQTTSVASEGLSVFTSENPESNALRSFVVVPAKYEIPQGISQSVANPTLGKQAPFSIELLDKVADDEFVQWSISITKNTFGPIRIRSDYSGKKVVDKVSTNWTSYRLDKPVRDRQILVFEPRQQRHLPKHFNKGKSVSSNGVVEGGGTESIEVEGRNPRLSYEVEGRILDSNGQLVKSYKVTLQMDNKDLIRQEYINHYNIPHFASDETGNLPVPTRDELIRVPSRPAGYDGNTFSESEYQFMIDGGMINLSRQILNAYEQMKKFHQKPGSELKDLNDVSLTIPDSRLWLSSGWRNPERNEWFSSNPNDSHQLGIALDLMPNEIPRKKQAAIVYWVLWRAVKALSKQRPVFAQLEAANIPLGASSFNLDIEPKNGIPDAFDIADNLHIHLIK